MKREPKGRPPGKSDAIKPYIPGDHLNRNHFALLTDEGRTPFWKLWNSGVQIGNNIRGLCREDRKLAWMLGTYIANNHKRIAEYPKEVEQKEEQIAYLEKLLLEAREQKAASETAEAPDVGEG